MSTTTRVPLILDVDTGIDDALALLYACASPEADLVAVTCLSGNVAAQDVGRNTRAVLELAGRADIEVAVGRDVPLLRALEITPETHGPHGIGYAVLPEPSAPLSGRYAPDLIVAEARRRPGEITLVTLGPLTNLAVAVLMEPRLPRLLKRWIAMGGAFRSPGNTTPTTEWNIHCDPEAARIAFAGWQAAVDADPQVPRVLVLGLDVTEQARILPGDVAALAAVAADTGDLALDLDLDLDLEPDSVRRATTDNPIVAFIADALRYYFEFHARFDGFYGAFIHDPLVTAVALDPTLVRSEPAAVDVDTAGGRADGQTIADWRGLWGRTPNADVAVEADATEFLRRLVERIGGLATARGRQPPTRAASRRPGPPAADRDRQQPTVRRADGTRPLGRSADPSACRRADDGGDRRSPMRILLAVDGSVSSDRATELVSTLPLPPESVIRVVAVQQPFADVLAMSWASIGVAARSDETEEEEDARHLREAIERAEIALKRPDLTLEGFLVRGRPASAIVDEAGAMAADLVVLGSRGHGTIATMVLGSTASEVVDHASCPVLVARSSALGTVALADDGSKSARAAEAIVTAWPLFADREISVVTVAEVAVPVAAGFTPGLYDQVLESYTRSVDEARQEVAVESQAAARRLSDAGLRATSVVLDGDPAAEIVGYATERGAGTIVMGTHGRTGLARLFLGSVARNVLLHAPCSVLVVRADR